MEILKRLSDIPRNSSVVLYGAGQGGSNFLKVLRIFRTDIEVIGFIDMFQKGRKEGLTIASPEEWASGKIGRGHLVLIVSIKWRDIRLKLKEIEAKGKPVDCLIVPPRFLVPSGYLKLSRNRLIEPEKNTLSPALFSPEDREQYREQLEAVEALLEQPEDRRLYRILTGRTENGRERLDALAEWYYQTRLNRQYFDYIDYGTVRTVIEGGVADGADTQAFIDTMKPGGKVYGFEPNIDDYYRGQYYKKQSANSAVAINPKGLWAHSGKLYFRAAGLSSSFTDREPKDPDSWEKVDVVSIDDYVQAEGIEKVDLIKLDIEGAELEALEGAQQTLKIHRPHLAVCLYHRKEHFYQIPQYLADLLPGYRYRLGHYTAGTLETVWYAVPGS
jgi:FkbM family methyltransferase